MWFTAASYQGPGWISPSIIWHLQSKRIVTFPNDDFKIKQALQSGFRPYKMVKFRIYVIKFKYPPQRISFCTLFPLANHFTDWLPWHPYNLIFCRAPVLTLPQESIFVFSPSRGRSKQLLWLCSAFSREVWPLFSGKKSKQVATASSVRSCLISISVYHWSITGSSRDIKS